MKTTTTTSYVVTLPGYDMTCWDSYTEALVYVMDAQPGCTIGHAGDITDGGDRTLVWACEDDADGDDGSQAVAQIVRRVR